MAKVIPGASSTAVHPSEHQWHSLVYRSTGARQNVPVQHDMNQNGPELKFDASSIATRFQRYLQQPMKFRRSRRHGSSSALDCAITNSNMPAKHARTVPGPTVICRHRVAQYERTAQAAAAFRNLDAATTSRSTETELQNTMEPRATATEIAVPKPDLGNKAKKVRSWFGVYK